MSLRTSSLNGAVSRPNVAARSPARVAGLLSIAASVGLVHGPADVVVPFAHSEVLAQALIDQGVSAQLVPIEGADHIFNGHDDIDGIVRLSVDYLAEALHSGFG